MSIHTDPHKTQRRLLPYGFRMTPKGKLAISNTNGQTLLVTHGEVQNILQRDDLDVHRRRMYEAALEIFKAEEGKQQ